MPILVTHSTGYRKAKSQLAKAQALFRQFLSAGAPSLADELIAERRADAARE